MASVTGRGATVAGTGVATLLVQGRFTILSYMIRYCWKAVAENYPTIVIGKPVGYLGSEPSVATTYPVVG